MKIGVIFLSGVVFFGLSCTTLSLEDLGVLARDLPRHNSFQYLTRFSLPAKYFQAAYGALDDPHVYLVLSDTGSPAGKVIGLFTASPYNHISLSFDPALETLVSYNGGNGISSPGLNPERLQHLNRKPGASLAVYRLKTTGGQKRALIDRLAVINREGSSYNLLGLLTGKSSLPNIMFCSQFVYTVLEDTGAAYFNKKEGKVKPMDFVNLARGDRLEFAGKIAFNIRAADRGLPGVKGRTSIFAAGVSNSPKRARDWRGVKQPRRVAPGPERSGAPESPVAASRRCAQYKLDIWPKKFSMILDSRSITAYNLIQ